MRNFVGACGECEVAIVEGEIAAGYGGLEQNLEIDFVIGHIDAGRVVDGVGVDAAASECVLDARRLSEAEIAALDDNFRAQLGCADSACIVGVVGDLGVSLGRRANVGADAAVVKQVDGRRVGSTAWTTRGCGRSPSRRWRGIPMTKWPPGSVSPGGTFMQARQDPTGLER